MLSTTPTPKNRASRGRARGLKTRVWGFCRRPATRAPVFGAQTTKPLRVAKATATKTASGPSQWLSRDPIEEQGGLNLYGMVGNDAVNGWDLLGLYDPDDPSRRDPVGNWRDNVIIGTGEITFNIKDYVNNAATGALTISIELYRTGEIRLDYVKLASELKAKGLTDAEASAARDALKMEFRAKQTQLGTAITQSELKARQMQGHVSSRANATKTNARINATAKVFKNAGRALGVASIAFEVYTVASAPDGQMGQEAARAGGRIAGGLAGASLAGEAGIVGGPWGVAAGIVGGGIAGSIFGEGAVDLFCSNLFGGEDDK